MGPLLAFLYGTIYLFFRDSPDWFVQSAAAGHLIFFLIWLGLYRCARGLSTRINPIFVMILACAWFVCARFFERWNSSNYLHMAMTAFALSHLLAYRSDPAASRLAWGSAFVGLSAMVRNDGLILCVSYLVLSAWLVWAGGRTSSWTAKGKQLAAALLPLILIVGSYTVSFGAGTMHRTYTAFELGELMTFRERYPQPSHAERRVRAIDDARARFGTPAENKDVVFRAIVANPSAYLERVAGSLARLPKLVYAAHGGPLSVILLFLAIRGSVVVFGTRQWWLLAAPFVWHAHLASYFLTFWDERYVRFPFVWLVLLAAFGVREVARNFKCPWERAFVAATLAMATGCAAMDASAPSLLLLAIPAVGVAGHMLFVAARRFFKGITQYSKCHSRAELFVALSLLALAAVAHGPVSTSFPRLSDARSSPPERALRSIAGDLPPSAVVASEGQRFPAAARAERLALSLMIEEGVPKTRKAVEDWLDRRHAHAVYLDQFAMRGPYRQAFRGMLLEDSPVGGRYVVRFADRASDTYVLVRSERDFLADGEPAEFGCGSRSPDACRGFMDNPG